MAKRVVAAVTLLALLITGGLPLIFMTFGSLFDSGGFSFDLYRKTLGDPHLRRLMGNSLLLASAVTAITVPAGVLLGILLEKTDLPLRRFFTLLFVIPLLLPPYITAVAWVGIPGRFPEPFTGSVLILSSVYPAIPMLLTIIFLRTVHPAIEAAARCEAGWTQVIRYITLPLIRPAIITAAILVFILVFGEFGVPEYLRFQVYPVESFTQFAAFYDFRAATAASLPLLAVTVLLLTAEEFRAGRTLRREQYAPAAEHRTLIRIKTGRVWIAAAVGVAALVCAALPPAALLHQAGNPAEWISPLKAAADCLGRSVAYAAITASLLICLGFFIALLIHDNTFRLGRAVDTWTVFMLALPGTVIGIGLIILWNRPAANFIYATPLLLLFGYLARYTAIPARIITVQLNRIPAELDEAARIDGAGWLRQVTQITFPLSVRALAGGWLAAYLFVLRDTAVTMLLYPPGQDTVSVRIFTMMANGKPQTIAILCILQILAALLPTGIAIFVLRLRKDR